MRSLFVILLLGLLTGISSAQDWVQLNGPSGDNNNIAVNSKGDIFVASEALHRSTDGGKTWVQLKTEENLISTIFVLPSDALITYYWPTGNRYLSTNNGDTWDLFFSNSSMWFGKNGYLFSISFHSDTLLYSSDEGLTWISKPFNITGNPFNFTGVFDITSDDSDIFYICSDFVYRSLNKGESWEKLTNGLPQKNQCISQVCVSPDGELFGVLSGYSQDSCIFRSTNKGVAWRRDSTAPNFYVNSISFSDNTIIIQGLPSYVSTDKGNTWQTMSSRYGSDFNMIYCATKTPTGEILFCDARQQLQRLQPASSVISKIEIPNGSVTAMIEDHGSIIAFTRSNDNGILVWKSALDHTQWEILPQIFQNPITKIIRDSSGRILAADGNAIVEVGGSYRHDFSETILSMIVKPDGTLFIFNPRNYIYRSTDNGVSWQKTNSVPPYSLQHELGVNRKGTVFLASASTYASEDNGDTWKIITGLKNLVHFTNIANGDILGGDGKILMQSTDDGVTWSKRMVDFAYLPLLLPLGSGDVLLTNNDDKIVRLDSGLNIVYPFSNGIRDPLVSCFTQDVEGYVYVASKNSGIFRSKEKIYNTSTVHKPLIAANDVDFDTVGVGRWISKSIQVINTGTAPLILGKEFFIKDKIPFSVDTLLVSFPISVKPKDTVTIPILFHPPQIANYVSEIDWATNVDPAFEKYLYHVTKLHGVAVAKSSVKDILQDDFSISIHPNPANGNSVVVNMSEVKEVATLTLFDVLGTELYKAKVLQGMTKIEIPITNIPEGIYYIRLSSKDRTIIEKFVKGK